MNIMKVKAGITMKNNKFFNFIFLHFCILLFTATTILSKYASSFEFLSINYIIIFGLMMLNLGVYAILWQQAIKPFKASVAYSNKSVTTIWTLIFSAILFNERITINNIIGALIIIFGVVLVASENE